MKIAKCFSVLIVLFLYTLHGHAYPSVGDKVKWEGSINLIDGSTTPIQITKEVLKFDPEIKKWIVKYQSTVGPDTSTEIVEAENLFSPEQYQELISGCTSKGGVLQKFTAPAGTYETCKMTTTTSEGVVIEKWWGNIPFGVVSKATKDPRNIKITKPNIKSVIADL